MSIRQNILKLRQLYDVTQGQLAEIAGVSRGAVAQWEGGFSEPRMGSIQKIADYFHISKSHIIEDDGMDYIDPVTKKPKGSPVLPPNAIRAIPSSRLVPLYGSTHMGETTDEEPAERMIEVPDCVMDAHPAAYLVHADGCCMDNRYPDDCVLLVDPTMEPFNGCAVLAETEDYQSVVRVYMRGSGTLLLAPDSHTGNYDDIVIRPDDAPVTLKGVVVWYQAEEDVREG